MSLKKFMITFLVTTVMLAGLSALVLYLSFSQFSLPGLGISKTSMSGRTNILVLGTDVGGQNSDSMMLVSVDHDTKAVDLLTIPRDTRVRINGEYAKINAAHAIGGEELAVEVVQDLLGVEIPFYVSFDPAVFRDVIDAIGGVYFDVPERMVYDDPYQDLHIDLYPGYQLLDGDHAEQLVRYRQYTFGDMDRTSVQRDFVKALVEQKLNMSLITKIDDLYDVFSESVVTNMSLSEMIKIASDCRSIDMNQFRTHVVPCELKDIDGISYVEVCQDELEQMMVDFFGIEIPGVTKTPDELRGNGTEGNGIRTEGDSETEENDGYTFDIDSYEDDYYDGGYYEDDVMDYEDDNYYDESGEVYTDDVDDVYYDENGDYYYIEE